MDVGAGGCARHLGCKPSFSTTLRYNTFLGVDCWACFQTLFHTVSKNLHKVSKRFRKVSVVHKTSRGLKFWETLWMWIFQYPLFSRFQGKHFFCKVSLESRGVFRTLSTKIHKVSKNHRKLSQRLRGSHSLCPQVFLPNFKPSAVCMETLRSFVRL